MMWAGALVTLAGVILFLLIALVVEVFCATLERLLP
jgi:hypothetical protein